MPRAIPSPTPELKPYSRSPPATPPPPDPSAPPQMPSTHQPKKTKSKTSAKMRAAGSAAGAAGAGGAAGAARAKGKPWTPAEYVALYEHVAAHGRAAWDGAVPGRTGNQSKQTWRNTLDPLIKRLLLDRAAK